MQESSTCISYAFDFELLMFFIKKMSCGHGVIVFLTLVFIMMQFNILLSFRLIEKFCCFSANSLNHAQRKRFILII